MLEAVTHDPEGGTGDVKYHYGARGHAQDASTASVDVRLASNPSHLESVDPVVEGDDARDPDRPRSRRGRTTRDRRWPS